MEESWLADQFEAGRSIEAIARETGRPPSTVAYWVNKHGLASQHAARHAARGGLTREQVEPLVEQGLSIRQIAAVLDLSATAVRHWLAKFDLKTAPSRYPRGSTASSIMRECGVHGWIRFVRSGQRGHFRCGRCNTEAVTERRRQSRPCSSRNSVALVSAADSHSTPARSSSTMWIRSQSDSRLVAEG